MEANPRYLSTSAAVRWMHARGRRVIGWGLGSPPLSAPLAGFRQRGRLSFLGQFDALISYSRRGAQEYANLGFPRGKIFVAHNSVSPAPDSPPRRSTINARPTILFVGRLQARKRLDSLLQACADLGSDPRLIIVGDGPDKKMLEETASAKGADVSWIGVVPNGRLPELLCGYQYFILPSLWEGMPKALLEAMAAGLVCIGTDTTGINEVITDGVTGYLSSGPSALELTKAIRRAIEGDKERISSAATDLVVQTYSLTAIASKESEIFNSLLSTSANRCIGENK